MMHSPANMTAFLADMTAGTKVKHLLGIKNDAEHTNEDRVVWIPSEIDSRNAAFTIRNGEVCGGFSASFDVSIYALDYERLFQKRCDLYAWVDLLIGPPKGGVGETSDQDRGGYEIQKTLVAQRQQGFGGVTRVSMFGPVVRRFFPLVPVTSVGVSIAATDINGGTPETVINTEVDAA